MPRFDDATDRFDDLVDRLPLVEDRTTAIVGVVTAVALLARLVVLGDRVAHFDEGRVGYWVIHFMETGEFHYRFIIHGPFVQHVNTYVFALLGTSDFTLRLVVAVIGGLLPLSVLLFREHLRRAETVAAALFLSFNPVLLYYSRFFRSTVPVAAFSFVAFGLLVRLYDTRKPRYFHAAVGFVALAFAAKENAAVYVLVWLGASALLLDYGLFRPRTASTGVEWLREQWRERVSDRGLPRLLLRYVGHVVLAAVLFLVLFVYFYAPRAGPQGGVGLWTSLLDGNLWALLGQTWADVERGYAYWFGGGLESGEAYASLLARFIAFFARFVGTTVAYAAPLMVFSVLGFFVERYASERRRNLVMFTGYWGFVSVLGYPLAADIYGAWITVNALVPLAIPAAVGVALIYRWGRQSLRHDDRIGAGITATVLVLVALFVVSTSVSAVYLHPQSPSNGLVQYAQPADDFHPTLRDVRELSAKNEGVDVLFYGPTLVQPGGDVAPHCTDISNTLPLEWYLARYDANATCAATRAGLEGVLVGEDPPVIITTPDEADEVRERLSGYVSRTRQLRTGNTTRSLRTFFLDLARLNRTAGANGGT